MAGDFLILKSDCELCPYRITVPQHSESSANDKTDGKFVYIAPGRIHKTTITGRIEV